MSPDDARAARLLSADLAPPLGLDPRTCHIAEVARQVSMALRFLGLRLNLQCPQVTCQLYHSLSDPLGSVHPVTRYERFVSYDAGPSRLINASGRPSRCHS